MSDSVWPCGLKHARFPCPSPSPRACSKSCPLSQWCCPTISSSVTILSPPAFNLSSIRVFSNELAHCIRWPKYWSFSFSISPSNEYSGLISFRMDWLDLLAVQVTLKSLLQYHSSKSSTLRHSVFFMAHVSHPCRTTRKTIALNTWTFVGKVMSLLCNMLPRFVIDACFSSKEQVACNFMAAVTFCSDFGAQENKVCHCYLLKWMIRRGLSQSNHTIF